MGLPAFPPYSLGMFVNRVREIEIVRETAKRLLGGERGVKRTIIFRGTHGVGKTWLALHLHRSILPTIDSQRLTSVFIRLASQPVGVGDETFIPNKENELYVEVNDRSTQREIDNQIAHIVKWLVEILQTKTDTNASIRELSNWLGRDVGHRIDKREIYVFVIDSVYEAPRIFLEKLEENVIGPLAVHPNVMIIMTGRGPSYPWESPYLRVEVQERYLEPLGKEDTQEQLKRQRPEASSSVSTIISLGGGYPGNNYLIAHALEHTSDLDEVIDRLLSVVNVVDRAKIRTYLEALCLLDGFRENDILPMLAALHDEPTYTNKSLSEARAIRDELVKYDLIRWDRTVFRIDEAIRRVLEHYLMNQKKELARRLHRRAYDLHMKYADGSKYRDHYERRAQKHSDALSTLQVDTGSGSTPRLSLPS